MNDRSPLPEPASTPANPGIQALGRLLAGGGWKAAPLTIFSHEWPDGTVDTLTIVHEFAANTERVDPDGFSVWRHFGIPLEDAVTALRALPPPSDPNAPRKQSALRLDREILYPPEPPESS